MHWNSILNESFLNVVNLLFYGLTWLKVLLLLKYIDGRCSYRETWSPSLSLKECSLPQSLIGLESNLNTIYLFSETRRGYREAEVSDGSFKHTWLLNLEFLLTWPFFSVWLEAPECSTEKLWSTSTMKCHWLLLMTILQPFFNFWTVDHVFKWAGYEIPLKCLVQFLSFYLSSMAWQHLVGVVQRNQPCLHGHPMCGIV